jgi:hypothetical protein
MGWRDWRELIVDGVVCWQVIKELGRAVGSEGLVGGQTLDLKATQDDEEVSSSMSMCPSLSFACPVARPLLLVLCILRLC